MDSRHAKAMFQIIVGARQSLHVIAMKEPSGKVAGDMTKVFNSFTQRSCIRFLLLHLRNERQVALSNLFSGVLLHIGQDLCRLMH